MPEHKVIVTWLMMLRDASKIIRNNEIIRVLKPDEILRKSD